MAEDLRTVAERYKDDDKAPGILARGLLQALDDRRKLRDSLRWTTNIICGVGKAGNEPTDDEIAAAAEDGQVTLDEVPE